VVAAILAGGCRRRARPPPDLEEEPAIPPAQAIPEHAKPALVAPSAPAAGTSPGPASARPGLADPRAHDGGAGAPLPARDPRPALGFPIPEGLRPMTRTETTESYESPHSLEILERFFRAQLGRGARFEKRRFGFRVHFDDSPAFILVTRAGPHPQVTVIRPGQPVDRKPPL
jgi:hypothetical protein